MLGEDADRKTARVVRTIKACPTYLLPADQEARLPLRSAVLHLGWCDWDGTTVSVSSPMTIR